MKFFTAYTVTVYTSEKSGKIKIKNYGKISTARCYYKYHAKIYKQSLFAYFANKLKKLFIFLFLLFGMASSKGKISTELCQSI